MAKKQPSIADLLNQINPKKIEEYRRHLEGLALAESTIKRRLSSLRKFTNWAKKEGYLQKEPVKKVKMGRSSFSFLPSRFRPTLPTLPYLTKAYETYSSISITKYLHYAILIIFCVGLGMSLYNQLTGPKAELAEAYPSTLKTPKRYLSFQGRLTDSSNNPISPITNFVFKLYDEVGTGTPPIGGIQLWTSGDCSVDPDEDGIFSVLLGKDCGLEIDETVFSVNPQVWLQITVGTDPYDEILSPRIQIATVGYALSAETLQGFPPGTAVSNIPYIDSAGDITIAAANPSIISSSGTFGIEGQALSITTAAGGNIILAPGDTGVLNIELSGTTGNQMRVTDANITSGTLISGYAGTGATGFDLINLSVGSTETTKFKVNALGNAYIAGNLGIGISNPSYKLNVAGDTYIGGALTTTGNISSTGGLLSVLGSGNNLISGNLGIGATNPSYKLNVVGAGYFTTNLGVGATTSTVTLSVSGAFLDTNGQAGTSNQLLSSTGSAVDWVDITTIGIGGSGTINYLPKFTGNTTLGNSLLFDDGTNVGIGLTNPVNKLSVAGNADITGNLGIGITNPGAYKLNVNGDTYLGGAVSGVTSLTLSGAISGGTTYSGSGNITSTGGLINILGSGNNLLSGNLGIGATNPSYKLNVVGAGYFTTNLGVGATTSTATLSVSGAFLDTNGQPGTSNQLLSSTGSAVDWVDITTIGVGGSGTINYLPKFTGNTTLGNSLLFDDGTNVGIGLTNPVNKLSVAGNADITGNLGVGTTSPKNKLDVSGSVAIGSLPTAALPQANMLYVSGNVGIGTTGPYGTLMISSATHPLQFYESDGTTDKRMYGWTLTGDELNLTARNDAGTLVRNLVTFEHDGNTLITGNVGIGTTGPKNKLDISGAVAIGVLPGAALAQANMLYVSGNVGIGMTNPGAKLEVAGQVKITGGSPGTNKVLTSDSAGLATWENITSIGVGGSGTTNYLPKWTAGTTLGNSLLFDDGTNVGIGLTNPVNKLSVAGNMDITGNLGIGTTSPKNKLDVSGAVAIGSLPGAALPQANMLYVSGNVGIGTTGPGAKLETQDTTSASSTPITSLILKHAVGTTVGWGEKISFRNANNGELAYIRDFVEGANDIGLSFGTYSSGAKDNVLYIQGSGNVGIGTTNPGAKLEVAGQVKITGGTPGTNKVLTSDSAGLATWENITSIGVGGSGTTNYLPKWTAGTTLGNSLLFDDGTNVGIGLTNPVNKLSVSGNMDVTGNLGIGTTNPVYGKLEIDGAGGYQYGISLYSGTGGSMASSYLKTDGGSDYNWHLTRGGNDTKGIVIDKDGEVGIGIASPGSLLSLGSSTANTKLALYDGGSAFYGMGIQANDFRFHVWSSAADFNFYDAPAGNALMTIKGTGNVGIGTTSPKNKLDVVGAVAIGSLPGASLPQANMLYVSGNVGIGMTDPGAKLEVAGQVKITGGTPGTNKVLTSDSAGLATWENITTIGIGGSGAINYLPKFTGNTTLGISQLFDDGTNVGIGLTNPTNKLDVAGGVKIGAGYAGMGTTAPANGLLIEGNVGIGTTGPAYALDINGSLRTTGDINLTGSSRAIAGSGDIILQPGEGYYGSLYLKGRITSGYAGYPSIYMQTYNAANASTNRLYITGGEDTAKIIIENANVGIGTTGPGAKLEVAGQVKITGGSPGTNKVLTSDSAGLATWENITSIGVGGSGTTNYLPKWTAGTTLGNSLLFDDGTNVGIGLTNPVNKLSVAGNADITGNLGIGITNPGAYKLNVNGNTNLGGAVSGVTSLTLSGAVSGGTTYSGSGNITSTGGLINILGSGNNLISGNLGIGATNPSYKLNVVGAGYFTTNLGVGATTSTVTLSVSGAFLDTNGQPGTSNQLLSSTGSAVDWVDITTIGIGGSGAINYLPKFTGNTTLGISQLFDDGTNVGIGTTAPNNKLDVAGAVAIGSLPGASLPQANMLYVSGNVGIGTTGPGIWGEHLTIKAASGNSYGYAVHTNDWVGGTTGSVLITKFGASSGNTYSELSAMSAGSSAWNNLVLQQYGNVGIGTTNPEAPLHVIGDLYVSDGLSLYENAVSDGTVEAIKFCTGDGETNCVTDFSTLGGGLWEDGTYGVYENDKAVIVGVDEDFTHGIAEGIGDLRVASDMEVLGNAYFGGASNYLTISSGGDLSLYGTADTIDVSNVTGTKLIISGGNVGIGMTNPGAYKLNVAGDTYIGGALTTTGNISSTGGLLSVLGSGNNLISGNLGIGATNPSYKLNVVGAGYFTTNLGVGATTSTVTLSVSGAFLDTNGQPGTSNQLLSSTGSAVDWVDITTIGIGGSGTINYLPKFTGNTTLGISQLFDDGTNVGIGTTAPKNKLDVAGAVAIGTLPGAALPQANMLYVSGNVGIGTTNPGYKLDVEGQIDASTYYSIGGLQALRLLTSGNTTLVGQSGNASITGTYNNLIGLEAGAALTSGMGNNFIGYRAGYNTLADNYNVAIGHGALYTASTGESNVVVGANAGGYPSVGGTDPDYNTVIGEEAGFSLTGDGNIFIGYQAGYSETGSNKLYIENSNSSSPLIWGDFSTNTLGFNGNVGIGTTTPMNKLDVAGAVAIGSLPGAALPQANMLYVSGNVGIGTTGPGGTLDVGQSVTTASAGTYYSTKLNNSYTGTMASATPVASIYSLYNRPNIGIGGTSPQLTNLFVNYASGNIGIGTTTAVTNLYLNYAAAPITNGGSSVTNTYAFVSEAGAGSVGIGTTAPLNNLDVSGSVAIGSLPGAGPKQSNMLYVSGNVGIGTTDPGSYKLNVAGTAAFNNAGVTIDASNYVNAQRFVDIGTDYYLDPANITISGLFAGNVGIGTTNPGSYKLYVAGTAAFNNAGVTIDASNFVNAQRFVDIGTDYYLDPAASTISGLFAGNVGIGTTNPSARLDIGGATSTISNSAGDITIDATSNYISFAGDNLTNILNLYASGNVGIGTTAPNQQLEITGNLRLPTTTAITGIIYAGANRFIHNFGSNAFLGTNAGNLTLSGATDNTGIGEEALNGLTSGDWNTALGAYALNINDTGYYNVAVGLAALQTNTEGYNNVAVGGDALYNNISGDNNVAVGHDSLYQNTTGNNNIGIGFEALYYNQTGSNNTTIGYQAGKGTGIHNNSGNVFIGYQAGYSETGSNKLYIANASGTPLIYGDFSSGRVGIGTTNPSQKLEVYGGDIFIQDPTSSNAQLRVGESSTVQGILAWDTNNNWFDMSTYGGSYPLHLDNASSYIALQPSGYGNVSIGNASPKNKLDVAGAVAIGSLPTAALPQANMLYVSGNVGIGTTGPGDKLEVAGADSSIRITNTNDSSYWQLGTFLASDYNLGIQPSNASGVFAIRNSGSTNRLTLDTNTGNLVITGSITANFGVAGTNYFVCKTVSLEGSATLRDCSGSDYAEYFAAEPGLEPGDLLSASLNTSPENSRPYKLNSASKDYDSKLVGAVSTNGLVANEQLESTDILVALVGQVPLKVSTLNGSIEVGDPITSSQIPGIGMKATKAGPIIGKTLESFDGTQGETCPDNPEQRCGKILVFINLGWYDPDVYLTDTGDLYLEKEGEELVLKDSSGKIIDRVGAFAEAAIAELRTGLINAQEIITEKLTSQEVNTQKLISPLVETQEIKTERISLKEIEVADELTFKNENQETVASLDDQGNATFNGELTATKGKFGQLLTEEVKSQSLAVSQDATIAGTLYAKKIVSEEITSLQGKFGELLAATISAQKIQGLEERLAQLEFQPSPTPTPTPAPSPTPSPSPEPETDPMEDIGLDPEIEALVNEILNSSIEATSQADLSNINGDNLNIVNNLTVLGMTSLADTAVAGTLNIGGTMTLSDNSLNTLTGTLYLQNLGLGGIDILAGKITIDEQGNAVFEGNLTVKGRLALSQIEPLPEGEGEIVIDLNPESETGAESKFGKLLVKGIDNEIVASIDASGSAFFASLGIEADYTATQSGAIIAAADNWLDNGYFNLAIKTNAAAGLGILPAGETEIQIYNPYVTDQSLIYLVPSSNTSNKVLYLKAKRAHQEAIIDENGDELEPEQKGWFKVAIDQAISKEIKFNWWIVN